jgi:hypothetical protein
MKTNVSKFITLRNSSRAKSHHKLVKEARLTKGQHKIYVLLLFCFVFLSPRPAKTARPILTVYTSNDVVSRKEVPFGVLMLPKTSNGFIFPKSPKIWPLKRISSLIKSMSNISTVHAKSANESSVGAACKNKFRNWNEITDNLLGGVFLKIRPDENFKPKHPIE